MTAPTVTVVKLCTLGQTKLESGFARAKAVAFLAYLALEGRQNRQKIAEIFWEDALDPQNSLRNQVYQLKPIVQDALIVSRQSVQLDAQLDVFELQNHLEQGKFSQAIELYQGEFLAGFEAPLGSQLEEWLLTTRQFIKRQVLEAYLILSEQALVANDFKQMQTHLEQAKGMVVNSNKAVQHWFNSRLSNLEIQIDLRKTQLAPHNLPDSSSEFIGRNQEMKATLERFTDSAKLITYLGFGGIGKTRLALETARTALSNRQFLDGIYFLPLENVFDASQMQSRIAQILGIQIQGTQDLDQQIKDFIGPKSMLLVLDNLEQLVQEAPYLTELLEACPNLRLLCTSREVLGLAVEHVYPIQGLDTQTLHGGAVQLFLSRAKQDYLVSEQQLILEICQLLQGIPLAIELAVPQLHSYSLLSLLASLQQSMDALFDSSPDLPERQRSIRAVFLHSWNLLNLTERQALRRMAIFKNGANRQALLSIGDITLSHIATLIDKSFVQRAGQQRYTIHPLILEYSLKELTKETEFSQVETKHAQFYLDEIAKEMPHIRGAEATRILQKIETDFDNLQAAWVWALANKDFSRVAALEELVVYFDQKALFLQGIGFFEDANDKLKDVQDQPLMLSGIAIGIAWLHYRLGNAEKATFYGEYAVEHAKKEPELGKNNLSKAYNILGNAVLMDYKHMKALNYFDKAIKNCDSEALKIRKINILINMTGVYLVLEDFEGFWSAWESAQFLSQTITIDSIRVLLVLQKANFLLYYVPREEMTKFIPELIEVYQIAQSGFFGSQPHFEILLCQFYLATKETKAAEFWFQKFSLHGISQMNPALSFFSMAIHGKIELLKGNRSSAKDIFLQILFSRFESQRILAFFLMLVNIVQLLPRNFTEELQNFIKLVMAHRAMTNRKLLVNQYLNEASLFLEIDFNEEATDQQIETTRQNIVLNLRTII